MVEITKEKFEAYEGVRESGETNMFNVRLVEELSCEYGECLDKNDILEIIKNYSEYAEKYK